MPTGKSKDKARSGNYPQDVPASSESGAPSFVRQPGLFAVHGGGAVPGGEIVYEMEGDAIRVYRGDLPAGPKTPAVVTPVYGLGGPGTPAVPTGRVLVRCAEGVRIEDRRDQLEQAGYTLREPLSHAPQAGWVEAASGGIAAALKGIPKLAALPDVVHVEPQMLMPASRR